MNREIKFRGWWDGKTNKTTLPEMVYLGHDLDDWYPNYPVMQFTGLTDRHGVEIYEGDVVKNILGELDVVKYGFQSCDDCQAAYGFGTDNNDILEGHHIEVVGNIYEDSKLIKKEGK